MDLTHKREEKVRLGDPDFRSGYVIVDVFWSGPPSAPVLHAARMRGDYLDIWPNLTGIQRARLRQSLIRRLIKKGAFMTIIDIDVIDEALEDVTRMIKDLAGEIIHINPDGPGGGNPNLKIKAQNPEHARQIVREIYKGTDMTDAEIDELYIKKT